MILLQPQDDGYVAEVATFNTAVRNTPDFVTTPRSVEDVVEAIAFAQERQLRPHAQAAGHTDVAITDGLMISTRDLNSVSVDPSTKTATIGAGVQWGEVIGAAAEHGLFAISGSSPKVSVVGLLLGGGLGPLARSYGFSSDYLTAATVVTSAGDLLQASVDSEPDLFWALRGGKPVPGVVTDVTIRLVDLTTMYAGALYFDRDDIEGALRAWIEWTATADPRVTTSVAMIRFPDLDALPVVFRGRRLLSLRFAFPGPSEEGARLAEPLRLAAPVYVDDLGELPAAQVARIHNDPTEPGPSASTAMLLSHVDQKFASVLIDVAGPDVETPFTVVEVRHIGEQTTHDVPEGSAVCGRSASYTLEAIATDPACFTTSLQADSAVPPASGARVGTLPGAVELLQDEMESWAATEGNANFMKAPRSPEQWARIWPPAAWERLTEIRRRYDPDGLFPTSPIA
jgi:FAD/FMN-containing dehydrogenase